MHCRILTDVPLYFLSKVLTNCRTYKFKVIVFPCWVQGLRVHFLLNRVRDCGGSGAMYGIDHFLCHWVKIVFHSVLLHTEPREATEVRTTFRPSSNESWLPFSYKSPRKRDCVTPVDSTLQNFTITLVRSSFQNSFLTLPLSVSFFSRPYFFLTFTVFSPFSLSEQFILTMYSLEKYQKTWKEVRDKKSKSTIILITLRTMR